MAKNKWVIFDWSGVISDDRRPVYEANMLVWDIYGMERVGIETFLALSGANIFEYSESIGLVVEQQVLSRQYHEALTVVKAGGIVPIIYEDADPIITWLHESGFKLAVLSSHLTEHLLKELGDYGLTPVLNLVVGGVVNKVEGLQTLVQEQGVQEGYYIGDTIFDIRAAKAVGLKPIGVSTGYHSREALELENPAHLIRSLTELKDLFS